MIQNRIKCIDYFRGAAILCVIGYHLITLYMEQLPEIIKYAANAGGSGVLVFFFCSGFSLYFSDSKRHRSYALFWKNKILKIYLPYIVVVIISALIPVFEQKNSVVAVFSHILLFRTFSYEYFYSFGGHFWYISTLFQLYAVFFVLKRLLDLLEKKWFVLILTFITIGYVIILAIMGMEDNIVLVRLFPRYLLEFGIGMVAAKCYIDGTFPWRKIKISKFFFAGFIGICLYGISSMIPLGRFLNDLPAFLGFISWFYALYKAGFCKQLLNKISTISFEWYLSHMLIFTIVFSFADKSILSECCCAIFAFVLSILIAFAYSKLWHAIWGLRSDNFLKFYT